MSERYSEDLIFGILFLTALVEEVLGSIKKAADITSTYNRTALVADCQRQCTAQQSPPVCLSLIFQCPVLLLLVQ